MFNDNEALTILQTGKVSLKPINSVKPDGGIVQVIRIFCDVTGDVLHECKGAGVDQEALQWIVANRKAVSYVASDDEKDKQRVSELEKKLADTNERLDQIVRATAPAPEPDKPEAARPRRGVRAGEPSPELAASKDA
ncbi:MAG TPA: hypothetical protein VEB22_06885 [Phycisphaerales bacterium]|nr:hypothetical protein [Phycisphaerales bacterium]